MQNEELIKAGRQSADAIKTASLRATIMYQLCDALEAADKAQRWIPCSERLPEPNTETLVLTDAGSIRQGYIGHATGHWCSGGFVMVPTVTHWQPLPQPPQKG